MKTPTIVTVYSKIIPKVVFLAYVSLFLSGCGKGGTSRQSSSTSAWARFESEQGGFSALMPGHPREVITKPEGTNGASIQIHNFVVDSNTSKEFYASYFDVPSEVVPYLEEKTSLDGAVKGVLNYSRKFGECRLIYSEDGRFGLNPMRDIKIEASDKKWLITVRLIIVGRRVYQLMVSESESNAEKDVGTCFESFQLKKH